MNQVNNLIQYKNLTDEQEAGYDFEYYSYERQNSNSEYTNFNKHTTRVEPLSNAVYRLVIEKDKWYACTYEGEDTVIQGHLLIQENHDRSVEYSEYESIRPATLAEVIKVEPPKPVTLEDTIQILWPDKEFRMFEWCGDVWSMQGEAHIVAQSHKGFWKYVYMLDNGDIYVDREPTDSFDTEVLIPVGVLFV